MKKIYFLLTTLFVFNSCTSAQSKFNGEFDFKTLHYIRTSNDRGYDHKIKKYGRDHFLFGKGKVKVFFDKSTKKHIISFKYSQPSGNRFSKYPKMKYRNYNFDVRNIILFKDELRFTLTAEMGTVMFDGKIFKEKGETIFAIEKGFTKYGHINKKTNPWFYKIDDEYIYYNLKKEKSLEKEFLKNQIVFMKDSIKDIELEKIKVERLKNGVKYLEVLDKK